jgi:hypothetical protein
MSDVAEAPVAAEVREAPPPPPAPSFIVRGGVGYGRGQLFVGSSNARETWRIPVTLEAGKMLRRELAMTASLVVEPGKSENGLTMMRVAVGTSFELHGGPLFVGIGPHLSWFGAWRKSDGPTGSGFVEAESVLWRVGLGAHAMIGVDVHVAKRAGFFTAFRADADALLSVGSPAASFGTITGVVGVSYH